MKFNYHPIQVIVRLLLLWITCLIHTTYASTLQELQNCQLVPQEWADGDSFQIKTPKGDIYTVRLYGADCLEEKVTNTTDARRLRAQRRYFGITEVKGSAPVSIALAKKLGGKATEMRKQLVSKPFTVYTAFADARGDRRYKRIYAFVVLHDGRDLASVLVENGLARAYGVSRTCWDGRTSKDYEEALKDLEMLAAKKGRGIWAHTDWEKFVTDRQAQREDDRLAAMAIDNKKLPPQSININSASRDELMQLPGVGETTANAIIQKRPYKKPNDLLRVNGIGPKTVAKVKPYLEF